MRNPLLFILLLGLVSLFSDMTYEGARGITGPFLLSLGASGAVVAFTSGLGEFLGYALRLPAGFIADKTKRFWGLTIAGYFINLMSIPALSLVSRWESASLLILLERMGKAIRTPARDAMLSFATTKIGRGLGFGLHEAMDQIGALLGPLIIFSVFYFGGTYHEAFKILFIPAVIALCLLILARILFPQPESLEVKVPSLEPKAFQKAFWLYVVAISLNGAGYADFPLIAYHLKKMGYFSDSLIPLLYALAMGVDALSALIFGYLFDRKGFTVLMFSILLSSLFAPLCFLSGFHGSLLGIILWGVGMGAQESIMRGALGLFVPKEKRGQAYGLFHFLFGLSWFLGSTLLGILYDLSISALVFASLLLQASSLPFLWRLRGKAKEF